VIETAHIPIDHGGGRIGPHAHGADDMAGALCFGDVLDVCGPDCGEDVGVSVLCGLQTCARLIIKIILDAGQGHAVGILSGWMQRYAVFGVGGLFHKRREPDLTRCGVFDRGLEVITAQALASEFLCGGHRRTRGPAVSVIADFDAERTAICSEIPVAQVFNAGRRQRATVGQIGSAASA